MPPNKERERDLGIQTGRVALQRKVLDQISKLRGRICFLFLFWEISKGQKHITFFRDIAVKKRLNLKWRFLPLKNRKTKQIHFL